MKSILFQLGKEKFTIAIEQVISIEQIGEITKITNDNSYITGLTEVRGELINVINMYKLLPVSTFLQSWSDHKIILIVHRGKYFGLLVQDVCDVIEISKSNIEPLQMKDTSGFCYLDGVTKIDSQLVVLLNLEKLINSLNLEVQETVDN